MERTKKRKELADIFFEYGNAYKKRYNLTFRIEKIMRSIVSCRTAVLGGHVDRCEKCGYERPFYNSCRNRHCPKCGALARERWLLSRKKLILPVHYFHVVFTVPDILNPVFLTNRREMYNLLFRAGAETLLQLGKDPKHLGADIGIIATLHTWGQNLMDHPHLHCIVTGGGLSPNGKNWIRSRQISENRDFFIHVNVLSALFKKKFIFYMKEAYDSGTLKLTGKMENLASKTEFKKFKNALYGKKWITYSKAPFKGAETVLEYLGRYVYRVAISNSRILDVKNGMVTFKWKDYRYNTVKPMTLEALEFIRRFLMHILPEGFTKIRYYGILASRNLKGKLKRCREILLHRLEPDAMINTDWQALFLAVTGIDLRICPVCRKGRMRTNTMIPKLNYAPP